MTLSVYIFVLIISYGLGSTPSGYLAAKARGVDIRTVGSGNIGATNVFRVLGKTAGIAVLAADGLKGFAAGRFVPYLALYLFPKCGVPREHLALAAGVGAILGHIYTFWLHFKGGKGIATSGGVVMAWAPLACVTALATWGILLVLTRFVSVASIAAAIILPFAVWFWDGSPTMTYVMAGISLLAIYKHKGNIQRLLKGEENRIGKKENLDRMKVTVIGAGAWGTALANLLRHNRHSVTLWGHNAALLEQITATGRNDLYLPQIVLAPGIRCQADLQLAVEDSECVILAVPSKFFREVTSRIFTFKGLAVSVTKGIEAETGLTMTGILNLTMPQASAAVLSGPSLALEVAREIPAAVVAAHNNLEVAKKTQALFHRPSFRVYTVQDAVGVELGGAVKNVIAIAAGVGDGLGFGDNSKAGLVTRGVAEMRRLGIARGAAADTFSGLGGLGDLVVTCYSKLSRNRAFGERVGRGDKVSAILASTRSVAEGYPTALAAWQLARKLDIQTPIIDEVHAMLYQNKPVRKAVQDLMGRDVKQED